MSWVVQAAEVGAASFTAVAAILGGLSWIYRRGKSEQKLVSAVEGNTEATTLLTATFENWSLKTDGTLTDHEKRITRSEDRLDRAEADIADMRKQRAAR